MADANRVCMLPWCSDAKQPDDALCKTHWNRLPKDLVAEYWATDPYSDARRGMLLKVFRYAFANKGRMNMEVVK